MGWEFQDVPPPPTRNPINNIESGCTNTEKTGCVHQYAKRMSMVIRKSGSLIHNFSYLANFNEGKFNCKFE